MMEISHHSLHTHSISYILIDSNITEELGRNLNFWTAYTKFYIQGIAFLFLILFFVRLVLS